MQPRLMCWWWQIPVILTTTRIAPQVGFAICAAQILQNKTLPASGAKLFLLMYTIITAYFR
jgi:hypothetical protein